MRWHAGLLLAALALGGCAGSLFKTAVAPPKLYQLSAAPADAAAEHAQLPADLAVLKPRVRAGLDTDRIAALYPDRRLDYFADARWTGPLDEVLQDLVVQVFHTQIGMQHVSTDASAFASMYWLEIQVMDFEAQYDAAGGAPRVHVALHATIGGAADRRIIARFETEAWQQAGDNSMHAIVAAYDLAANHVLAELAGRCARALNEDQKPNSPSASASR